MMNLSVSGLAAGLYLLSGCAMAQKVPSEMSSSFNPSPKWFSASARNCDLVFGIQTSDQSVQLRYEFRNQSNQTAFLFNRVLRADASGGSEPDANLVYVEKSGDALILSKKIIPVPDDIDVEKPDVPYVTRVRPGDVFVEVISLKLPLHLFTPYLEDEPYQDFMAETYFQLGFFLAPDPSVVKDTGKHLVISPFSPESQIVMQVGPIGRFPVASPP